MEMRIESWDTKDVFCSIGESLLSVYTIYTYLYWTEMQADAFTKHNLSQVVNSEKKRTFFVNSAWGSHVSMAGGKITDIY